MIETEDLSFRELECFEHSVRQREENRIFMPVKLSQGGSSRKALKWPRPKSRIS
jgi:hypothetical protein